MSGNLLHKDISMQSSKMRLLSGFLFGLFLLSACLSLSAVAQTTAPNEWTWVGGSNTANQSGVYGTLKSPATGNIPGARNQPANWTDSSGNLWLFGGVGIDANGNSGFLNDLWKFNPATKEWAWMGGSSIMTKTNNVWGQRGVYGTLGTPGTGNIPGGRYGAASWTDNSGNLWLFGGYGLAIDAPSYTDGPLNDLWEYSTSTNEWTWMGGHSQVHSSSCTFGTLKTPATGNYPCITENATSWNGSSGNLWLFGGIGTGVSSLASNDLWKFYPSTNPSTIEWAWMSGGDNLAESYSTVYGALGVQAAGNTPGGREGTSSWTDSNGDLWLFGGYGESFDTIYWTDLNELWEFNPSNNEWALWMPGSSTAEYQFGIFGTLGMPAAGNIPGGRTYASNWTDNSGNFWLFGGRDTDWEKGSTWGVLNDIWEFNPTTKEWTWMGGSSPERSSQESCYISYFTEYCGQSGVYGTSGTPAPENLPGGRASAVSWTDKNGNLWLFGGSGFDINGTSGYLNDMWEYQPSTTPSFPTAVKPVISPSGGSFTTSASVTITDSTPNALIYYTTDGVTTPTTSSTLYTGAITLTTTETIRAVAMAANYLNSAVASQTYTVNLPTAAQPTILPAAATYTSVKSVTITDTTPNATIYYAINGTPTTSSTVYNGTAITVSTSETIEAIAVAPNYLNSTVASATYIIDLPPDFSVPATLPPVTVTTGTSWNENIAVTPLNGFTGNVSFSCSNLPTEATCSFLPNTITGSGSTKITVTATAPFTASLDRNTNPFLPASALAALLCCFGLRKRRRLQMLLLVVVSLAGLSLVTSCGGGSSAISSPKVPYYTPLPNTETVTVTAASGSLTHGTTFTLTVN
jgi:N-acetylneuraminic acid mutarotase